MKRGFRGRDYNIKKGIPLILISELVEKKRTNQDVIFSNEELLFWKEMKLDKALDTIPLEDDIKVVGAIRRTILQQYNKQVSDTLLLHYLYLKKYISCLKKRGSEKQDRQKNDVLLVDIQKYGDKDWCIKYNEILYQNCVFLEIIDKTSGSVDNTFLHRWQYYPVSDTFINTVEDMKADIGYSDFKAREYEIYNTLLQGAVHIGNIESVFIKKEGKIREVCVLKSSIDKLVVNYLARRMREVFKVSFLNRDKIMEIVINLVDSLPKLQDYTIYRFDFKDFFKSVSAKLIYEKYIKESDMYRFEKKILLELIEKTKDFGCAQGLATSNVLIEIISNEFDNAVITSFDDLGIVLYKRYVDDGIIIFNRHVEIKEIRDIIQNKIDDIFNVAKNDDYRKFIIRKVTLSLKKEKYQTKYLGVKEFDYLGYAFYLEKLNGKIYYRYGIATRKLEKYKQQLRAIYKDYSVTGNERLLYHRLRFFISRIVYYDYSGYRYKGDRKWDVQGLINSYRMLKRFMIYVLNENKIMDETKEFLESYHKDLLKEMFITYRFIIPDFLKGKGIDNYSLWLAFEKNHSIVFQANIGWNIQYLAGAIKDITGNSYRGSYTDLVKKYLEVIFGKE